MKQKLANCPKFGDSLTGPELDVEAMLEAECERLRNKCEGLENELDAANQHVKILHAELVKRLV